ncbi:MAG: TrmH family RNA methyltransferase [Candidatus Omnitrophica bacterium]|nr:TrmH family RNA methyltransferase [Candidatus Omnitrophota bacterium]
MLKLNAKQLRTTKVDPKKAKNLPKNPIYIILDNVLDTYNIGSIFRLADAVGAQELIITGQSEVPPNTRIKKASINTTEWVKWQYVPTAVEAITKLKVKNPKLKVVAIEQSPQSVPYTEIKWEYPAVLVVGNETHGVSKEALKMADEIAELPMFGVNISLNVMVSLAIVLYQAIEDLQDNRKVTYST